LAINNVFLHFRMNRKVSIRLRYAQIDLEHTFGSSPERPKEVERWEGSSPGNHRKCNEAQSWKARLECPTTRFRYEPPLWSRHTEGFENNGFCNNRMCAITGQKNKVQTYAADKMNLWHGKRIPCTIRKTSAEFESRKRAPIFFILKISWCTLPVDSELSACVWFSARARLSGWAELVWSDILLIVSIRYDRKLWREQKLYSIKIRSHLTQTNVG